MIVRELLTRLGFDADNDGARRHERALMNVRRAAVITSAAVAAVGGAMLVMVRETAAAGDQLAKTSAKLGIATDALQELRFAAERSGVASGTLDMALQRMTRRLSEAGKGGGEALNAIKELGLNASELAAMAPEDAVNRISDALAGVPNQADRVRLAFKFFDSEGVALVNMMQDGSEGVNRLREEFRALGGGISADGAKNAEEFTDAMGDMRLVIRNLRYAVGQQLMPAITDIVVVFTEWYKINGEIIRQNLGRAVDALSAIFGTLWRVLGGVLGIVDDVAQSMGGWETVMRLIVAALSAMTANALVVGLTTLGSAVISAGGAAVFLGAMLKKIPGILALMAFAAVLEDLWAWVNGSESAIGKLLGTWEDFRDKWREILKSLGIPDGIADGVGALAAVFGLLLGYRTTMMLFGVAATGMGAGLTALATGLTALAASAAVKGVGILARVAGIASSTAGLAAIAMFTPTAVGDGTLPTDPDALKRLNDSLDVARPGFEPLGSGGASPNVNTNITMQLPPGTPQSQADFVQQEVAPIVRREISNAVDQSLRNYQGGE